MSKPTTYIQGDLAEYTGESKKLFSDTVYVLILKEGAYKGERRITYKAPGVRSYNGTIGNGQTNDK